MSASHVLAEQCDKASERCLFTSTTLLIWLRQLRLLRVVFIVLPIILGSLAGWKLLQSVQSVNLFTAGCAFLAGLIPAVYTALKLDDHLPIAGRLAGEYKNLEIVFADLRQVGPHKPFDIFEADYLAARARLEKANAESYTAPEYCFWMAQWKINRRKDYKFGKPGEVAISLSAE